VEKNSDERDCIGIIWSTGGCRYRTWLKGVKTMANESLIVMFSYHHHNTEKIASVFARVLDAQVKQPQQVNPEQLQECGLIGFGSGIYDEKHHQSLFDLVERLPQVTGSR
jgi:hypothetical protein